MYVFPHEFFAGALLSAMLVMAIWVVEFSSGGFKIRKNPSSIKSYTIGFILEQGFAILGRFGLVGRMGKFLKRRNFC